MTCAVRVITQSLEANTSKYRMIVVELSHVGDLSSKAKPGLNETTLICFRYEQKVSKPKRLHSKNLIQTKRKSRLMIRIRSVNRTKGDKLRFEYDHIAPSGFGIAPIKSLPTAMFSLVRIRPMFEQEAPK